MPYLSNDKMQWALPEKFRSTDEIKKCLIEVYNQNQNY